MRGPMTRDSKGCTCKGEWQNTRWMRGKDETESGGRTCKGGELQVK